MGFVRSDGCELSDEELTLPDPLPIEVWTREVRELVRDMTPEERAAAKARVKALGELVRVLERVFER